MTTDVNPAFETIEPIRRNSILLAARIFLILFLADTIYSLLLLAPILGYVSAPWNESYIVFLWVAHTVKTIFLTYLIITQVISWISTLYYVQNEHFIRQRGVFHIKETVFQLHDIESVHLNQSWLGKLFNFGDVIVTFLIARQKEEVNLYAINHPEIYEDLFSKYV